MSIKSLDLQDTREKVLVMTAFCNGQPIQFRVRNSNNDVWRVTGDPAWNWVTCEYRIAVDDRP